MKFNFNRENINEYDFQLQQKNSFIEYEFHFQ